MKKPKPTPIKPVPSAHEAMLAKVATAQGDFDKSLQQLMAARDNCIRKGQLLFSVRAAADDVMLRSIDEAIAGMKRTFTAAEPASS